MSSFLISCSQLKFENYEKYEASYFPTYEGEEHINLDITDTNMINKIFIFYNNLLDYKDGEKLSKNLLRNPFFAIT